MEGHTNHIPINTNPLASKVLPAAMMGIDPHDLIEDCMREILNGMELNTYDLPLYMAALSILTTSIKSQMSDTDEKIFNTLMKDTTVYTITGSAVNTDTTNMTEPTEPTEKVKPDE